MYLPGVTLTVCLLKELSITTTFDAMIALYLGHRCWILRSLMS